MDKKGGKKYKIVNVGKKAANAAATPLKHTAHKVSEKATKAKLEVEHSKPVKGLKKTTGNIKRVNEDYNKYKEEGGKSGRATYFAKEGLKSTKPGKTISQVNSDFNKYKDDGGELGKTAYFAKRAAKGTGKGIANKGKDLFHKAEDKIKETKTAIESTKVVSFIATWGFPMLIALAIIIVLFNIFVIVLGIFQSVSPTPHFYCDIKATKYVKNSSIYQQYCTRREQVWGVDNINGHYIVQDGKGPAASCAMLNMILRYYSINTRDMYFGNTNVYDYLWQADGQYNNRGNALGTSSNPKNSIRNILNNYNIDTPNDEESNASLAYGSREFALLHDKPDYSMSNWGYLRDESIDLKDYMMTRDYYDDDSDNRKWVWDLSLDNMSLGSVWGLNEDSNWDMSIRMNTTKFNVEQMTCPDGDEGYPILKKRIRDVLNNTRSTTGDGTWAEYYQGNAGVMVQYTKQVGSTTTLHTILITGYECSSCGKNCNNINHVVSWRGVDSSLGTSGGWEGPLDGTGRFVADDENIRALLNGGGAKYTRYGTTYILEKIGYCTKSRFSFITDPIS